MTRSLIRPARLAAIGVFALAGLIFWVSFNTAQGTNIRSDDSMLRLSDLVQDRSRKNADLDSSAAALRRQVDALAQRDDGSTAGQKRRLSSLEKRAGLKKVSGDGLAVTLDDAPTNATAKVPGLPDPEPNDLVIHQQDLQAVVNALWKGGAEGIKVMDQRLISTSAVRCVGNTLILQGRVYSPPYTVTAVGDRDKLRTALDKAPAIRNYLEYVDAYGLGWKVDEKKSVTLPGYSGTVDLRQAKPVG
ncbi:DUF881 domain-containing protein [Streptomyces sp. NBC_01795]|uniref:DUF881 domain-containing protein n=1 Tax=unclassified Streptomyces TaxID=2593676 RepID=UPI002DD9B1F0|nr:MULTISPECIES: DUF881 domain-containing protein [unclassified Streptomyces]WSA93605.1 DUF881 domain-containing protein [Streptomyces sp. NBC_01795]WSS13769.1 DUF881 domain-containing protein [Streptomyces sp. NBC_01186]